MGGHPGIEIASPDHDLVGVVIDRSDLETGELFAILMGQHLSFELRTVRAALGAHPINAVQAIVAHPGANLLVGDRPLSSHQLSHSILSPKNY